MTGREAEGKWEQLILVIRLLLENRRPDTQIGIIFKVMEHNIKISVTIKIFMSTFQQMPLLPIFQHYRILLKKAILFKAKSWKFQAQIWTQICLKF